MNNKKLNNFKLKYSKYKKKYLIKKSTIVSKIINNFIQMGGSQVKKQLENNLEILLRCPITLEIFIDPVIAADGHTYERKAIQKSFNKGNSKSPLTNNQLDNRTLTPNLRVKSIINSIIEMGILDMNIISNFLNKSGFSKDKIRLKKARIIRKKIDNGDKIEDKYKLLNIIGLSIHYKFDNVGNRIRSIFILLNNNKYYNFFDNESGESSYDYSTENKNNLENKLHIRPKDNNSFNSIILFKEENPLDHLSYLRKELISDNFEEVIKDKYKDNVKISPRISYKPVLYGFISGKSSNFLKSYFPTIPNLLIKDINDLYEKESKSIFVKLLDNVKQSDTLRGKFDEEIFYLHNDNFSNFSTLSLEIQKEKLEPFFSRANEQLNGSFKFCSVVLMDDPIEHFKVKPGVEIEKIDGSESWGKIIRDEGKVWRLENNRIAKKITENNKWKIKMIFSLAFTGKSGIGKSYLTHTIFNKDYIFETDGSTKESFKEDFEKFSKDKKFTVIVVGNKDKSFGIDFIREKIDIKVFECRMNEYLIENNDRKLTVEEKQAEDYENNDRKLTVEEKQAEDYENNDRKLTVEEKQAEDNNDRIRIPESDSDNDSDSDSDSDNDDDGQQYVIGYLEKEYRSDGLSFTRTDEGHYYGTNEELCLLFQNGEQLIIEKKFYYDDSYHSGYTGEYEWRMKYIENEFTMLDNPVIYNGYEDEGRYIYFNFGSENNEFQVTIDTVGWDNYYPSGSFEYSISDFTDYSISDDDD